MNLLNDLFEKFKINLVVVESVDEDMIDDILDDRDSSEFNVLWNKANKEIATIKLKKATQKKLDEMIKEIFKIVFSKTHHDELAAYTSDDFDLIAKHLLAQSKNTWVTNLCATYFTGKIFLKVELLHTTKTLKELVEQ